ncbi:hypothetical protein C427_1780 [Paraglaciecola psychrophila 170]|uniref:Uncharacterized protein n=1 Tax=Paraglaciecola psychrophila 170 TaxID=1129794 RepID=K7A9A0_9ALTE|nr:hypothetical protein C427_1780 [Paraglaciecola psychrophila 170]GAC37293.1 hypothetical protein GPSY_1664 [Paraglaciecola psychrophila 170]
MRVVWRFFYCLTLSIQTEIIIASIKPTNTTTIATPVQK